MLIKRYFIPAVAVEEKGNDTAVTLTTTLVLFGVMATLNYIGIHRVWYWNVWWYDIPMHFTGGAWSALLFFYVVEERLGVLSKIYRLEASRIKNIFTTFLLALSFVALIGVLWEFAEYLFDVFIAQPYALRMSQQGLADTVGDLFNDLAGGAALAWVYYMRKLRRRMAAPAAEPASAPDEFLRES